MDKLAKNSKVAVEVVDSDPHWTEPHDLFTRVAPAEYLDRVLRVEDEGIPTWEFDGHVLGEALALASHVAENAPLAVGMVKRLMRRGATDGGHAAWASRGQIRRVLESEDARDRALAFIAMRPPSWRRR